MVTSSAAAASSWASRSAESWVTAGQRQRIGHGASLAEDLLSSGAQKVQVIAGGRARGGQVPGGLGNT